MSTPIILDAGPSERGWHRIENAARCLRLFALNESGILKREASRPLVNGSLIHVGLAQWYVRLLEKQEGRDPEAYMEPGAAIEAVARENMKTASASEAALWEAGIDVTLPAMAAYMQWYGPDSEWKIISVEEELRAQLRRPGAPEGESKLFTQRADLIVQDKRGMYWIVDHKSCYRIAGKTLRQFILSGQFLGYQIFGRAKFGQKFGGVIVNRVKLSPPFGFDRATLEPAPHAIPRFIQNLLDVEDMVEQYEGRKAEDWPAVYSEQTCWGKYGQCPAFHLCQWGA